MRLLFDHGTVVVADPIDADLGASSALIWDSRVALYRAPAFRYADVVATLRERGLSFRDEVRRSPRDAPGEWAQVELRPYQRTALLSWELAGTRGIVVMPTGSGKTQLALAALAACRVRALCLVPTRALLQQWVAELRRVYRGAVGCLGDGRHQLEAVTVATYESAYRAMPSYGHRFDLVIADEAHHFGCGVRDEVLEMCIAERRLGLTATPPGEPALRRLAALIGPVTFRLSVADLTGSWLAPFDLVVLRLSLSPEERTRYAAERASFAEVSRTYWRHNPGGSWPEFVAVASQSIEGRAALNAWRRARHLLGFTRAKAFAVGRLLAQHRTSRVLVFTADNEAAYAIAREHLIMPITCDISRTERTRALEAFRSGELNALVSSRVLNEGIDVPDADVAIIVAGTQGEREHVQRIGRLLRPAPGKRALVYELVTAETTEAREAARRRRALAPANTLSAE